MTLHLAPGSPEWTRLITASKVAAILGVSPWESPRSVWHLMHGDTEAEPQKEHQSRGHYLEPAILAWWRDRHDIGHDEGREYQLQPSYRLGDWAAATPDMVACRPEDDTVLIEAKSAAYDDDWGEPGTDQIPTYYLTQVYFQMEVSGIHRTYVPIITSRLRFVEYVVDHDPAIGADLVQRMRSFYESLAADEPPPLDDSVATFDAIRKLHPDIERGESVELDEDEARRLVVEQDIYKTTEPRLRLAKSTVIERMGRAQYATHNGVRIARRQPRGDDVTFVVVAKPSDLTDLQESA